MTPRVLVVDDDPVQLELLTHILAAEGWDVLTASKGEEALERFSEFQADTVLLDVRMRTMSGFEVCRRLRQDPERRLTPIILLTGLCDDNDRVEGLRVGADDLLIKPVERDHLVARVQSALKIKSFTDELERAESVLFALARSIEAKDPYTEGHCDRLSRWSERLGQEIGLNEDEVIALRRAGTVHDIGKVAVPDAVLLKPARLTPEEYDVMKRHPVVGEQICAPLKSFRIALPIIRHHHEKLNGTGYPDGLKGKQIPLGARVLQIVDVYDALTTERPYKHAMSHEEALGTMEEEIAHGWWDPDLFQVFAGRGIAREQLMGVAD